MIKLKDLLFEAPAQPAPSAPERERDTEVMPGAPKTTPSPRRRSVPSPSTSPTPAPKASNIMKKIADRYANLAKNLHEADYEKIFDPETLKTLKGSVLQRVQGKNPMDIAIQMQKLALQVAEIEDGKEDVLEQLALDIVYKSYPYLASNKDLIKIDAKIVSQNEVKEALQPDNPEEENIDDLDQEEEDQMMQDIAGDLKKRRLINAITQGGSVRELKLTSADKQKYIRIINDPEFSGERAASTYRDLMQYAVDMIDFVALMSSQGRGMGGGGNIADSGVGAESVFYDFLNEKWVIKARATCFPVLILEIAKGMYELIGLFGFSDLERGEKVVSKVDKIENEPTDIAYGRTIANKLLGMIETLEANVTNEERDDLLQDIYKMENKEFIELITNVINGRVTSSQTNQLKGMLSQMRQDKAADAANNALMERVQRLAGIIK
jgi:hypothetical protein